jgi:hypothetical protein
MTRREVMDLINAFERLFPVGEWTLRGIRIWPLLRISLATALYRQSTGAGRSTGKISRRITGFAAGIRALVSDMTHNASERKRSDVVFLTNSLCRTRLSEGWYDRICGPFAEQFDRMGWSSLVLEATGDYVFRLPRASASVLIQPRIDTAYGVDFLSALADRGDGALFRRPDWLEFVRICGEKGVASALPPARSLVRSVSRIRRLSVMFRRMLRRIRPRLGMVEYYYGVNGMAFISACRSLGIPCVDIQHGVQGGLHAAYGNWANIPAEGYELLPDHFWCWTLRDAENIEGWTGRTPGSPHHHAVAGSNLWIERWNRSETGNAETGPESGKEILFTLQTGVEPASWVFEAMEHSPADWLWRVRLHPGMASRREEIRAMFVRRCPGARVELDEATDRPLFHWLNRVAVHVTSWSSAALEAEAFGVATVLTHANGGEIFSELVASGSALLASDAESLVSGIAMFAGSREIPSKKTWVSGDGFRELVSRMTAEGKVTRV